MPTMIKNPNPILPKSESWRMFDDIAPRYDSLNRILSFGLDRIWRRRMRGLLASQPEQNILDLASGTADVLLALVENNPKIKKATGVDLAEKMLTIARRKIKAKGLEAKIILESADIQQLPFSDDEKRSSDQYPTQRNLSRSAESVGFGFGDRSFLCGQYGGLDAGSFG